MQLETLCCVHDGLLVKLPLSDQFFDRETYP